MNSAQFEIHGTDDLRCTLKLTLTLGDWIRLQECLKYDTSTLGAGVLFSAIDRLVSQASIQIQTPVVLEYDEQGQAA